MAARITQDSCSESSILEEELQVSTDITLESHDCNGHKHATQGWCPGQEGDGDVGFAT